MGRITDNHSRLVTAPLTRRHCYIASQDGNGTISKDELRAVLESFGEKPDEDDLQKMMKECDTNDSDTIDFQEFCTLMGTYRWLRAARACIAHTSMHPAAFVLRKHKESTYARAPACACASSATHWNISGAVLSSHSHTHERH